jgi:hypothetical protein
MMVLFTTTVYRSAGFKGVSVPSVQSFKGSRQAAAQNYIVIKMEME